MKRILVAASSACLVAAVTLSAPALAHNAPKPGTPCKMPGNAAMTHGKIHVCELRGGQARWSKALTQRKTQLKAADTWAKAADSGMTAVFGVISNPTNRPVQVIGAMTSFSPVELHQVVMADGQMKMSPKAGGFTVPARGKLELKPGGDHIMLMKLSRPINAGTRVPVTLVTRDGGTLSFNAMGKPFAGGNENYDPGHGNHGSGM